MSSAPEIISSPSEPQARAPELSEIFWTWARIGLMSFGGPAGQIALMHKMMVDDKKWLSEEQYLHALSFCMFLPGPEAQQLATYSGWLTRGWRGGLIAGGLFVLPGFIIIQLLALLYDQLAGVSWFNAAFFGLKAAVLAIVLEALMKISKRALKTTLAIILAVLAFIALFVLSLPFPLVVLGSGLYGFLTATSEPRTKSAQKVPLAQSLKTVAIWLAIWLLPVGALIWGLGADALFSQVALFFSQMAVVSFGGAYAVLAYVAQEAVAGFGWLTAEQMIDGLALAETTPGPLVLVLTYVGYLAGTASPIFDSAILGGLAGGTIATFVTFAPCFLWIFAGAPYIERVRENPRLSAALSAITAAIVGVILNLTVWFAMHVLFVDVHILTFGPFSTSLPNLYSMDWTALVLMGVAALLLLRLNWKLEYLLPAAAIAGIVIKSVLG